MKEAILIALLLTMIFWFNSIDKRLEKLIELNTPQSIKAIPPEHILEDNLL